MTEQELNKKLAEWAGFRQASLPRDLTKGFHQGDWIQPDGHISIGGEGYSSAGKLPNFTQSLDACFKWLVPKLSRLYIYCPASNSPITVRINGKYRGEAETPALALCKAIEKLIQ